LLRSGYQVHQDFGVRRGLKDGTVFFELLTKGLCVDEVSVVRDGQALSLSLNK